MKDRFKRGFIAIPIITIENHLFKSWVFGVSIWFITYAITLLFGVPELAFIPLETTISNFIGASLWGILSSFVLKWMEARLV